MLKLNYKFENYKKILSFVKINRVDKKDESSNSFEITSNISKVKLELNAIVMLLNK